LGEEAGNNQKAPHRHFRKISGEAKMSIIRQPISKVIFLMVLAIVILLLAACSAPAEQLNQEGNQAFAEQAYLEALELYQSAQIESPELAEPYFNAANTFYRQADYPTALEQMQVALQYVDEETLAESSLYNMGNTLFNSQDLGKAVEAYKQALLLNPDDQDAKYNLELALQQQQQEQQQQQDQQQGENQDQGEEESESDSESGDDSKDQEGQDGESENNENQESQNGENQDEGEQGQDGDQSENNDQQEGDQENGEGQPQEGENPQDSEQPSQTPAPGQRMTEEQAKQLLAAIANDMETLQERLGQYLFARQAPPAQDW
jgi:Ca-activated chloride channel family protein